MNPNDAVSANHLLARLTEEVHLLFRVAGALQDLLGGRNVIHDIASQLLEADNFVGGEFFPFAFGVEILAFLTDELARSAVAGRLAFLALLALRFDWSAHLL